MDELKLFAKIIGLLLEDNEGVMVEFEGERFIMARQGSTLNLTEWEGSEGYADPAMTIPIEKSFESGTRVWLHEKQPH